MVPLFRGLATEFDPDNLKLVLEAIGFLEAYLTDDYLVGKHITVADFSCVASVSIALAIIPHDASQYPKILAWIQRLSKLPYYDEIITENVVFAKKRFEEINGKK